MDSRVSEDGHCVPADKVISRIHRVVAQARASLQLVEVLRVYDNSSALAPFVPVFTISDGGVNLHRHPLPSWAAGLLSDTQTT